jgi:hypothetical protein
MYYGNQQQGGPATAPTQLSASPPALSGNYFNALTVSETQATSVMSAANFLMQVAEQKTPLNFWQAQMVAAFTNGANAFLASFQPSSHVSPIPIQPVFQQSPAQQQPLLLADAAATVAGDRKAILVPFSPGQPSPVKPSIQQPETDYQNQSRFRILCKYWQQGTCNRISCSFSHDIVGPPEEYCVYCKESGHKMDSLQFHPLHERKCRNCGSMGQWERQCDCYGHVFKSTPSN